MKRTTNKTDLEPLPPEQADRLDTLFASIEPTDHARRIVALADAPEMATDLWELARLRDQWRE
jgi:hypothetical protein